MDPTTYLVELESVFGAQRRSQVAGQGADMAEAEAVKVSLRDRIAGAVGRCLRVHTRSGVCVEAVVRRVSSDALIGQARGGGLVVVRLDAIAVVAPVGVSAADQGAAHPGVRAALRDLRRRRARVVLNLLAGTVTGSIVQVGQDYVELTIEMSQRIDVRGADSVVAIALDAIEVVREC